MLTLTLILILIIVPACTWWFGFWNNLINVVNFVFAALIATSVYHPVANRIANIDQASYFGIADFTALWLVFALSFMILRGVTDTISKYKLKFDPITEMVGRSIFSLALGVGMVCFTSFSMHLAPLSNDLYAATNALEVDGSIPEKVWLGYVDYASVGPLAASKDKNMLFSEYKLDQVLEMDGIESRQFDPKDTFFEGGWWLRESIEDDKERRKKQKDEE